MVLVLNIWIGVIHSDPFLGSLNWIVLANNFNIEYMC
jgi:hypothetical protein